MKILFISLGCDKNLADSEQMLGILRNKGYEFTDDECEADIIVVNSCCFISDAKEESINTILDMAQCKTHYKCQALIVTGCLAERYKEEIYKEIPEVDAVIGTSSYDAIAEAVEQALEGKKPQVFKDLNRLPDIRTERVVTTGGYFAHLKIAEGCDKHCTYCIIPKVRGNYRSVPMENLLRQAKEAVAHGRRQDNHFQFSQEISKEMLYDRLRKDETIQALVHPAIKYLQALDEKSQGKTQYIHTLKTYLLSGINFSLSAKKLNLHRNTLISRIHKIESLTGIDLNTNASLESLLLSIIIS